VWVDSHSVQADSFALDFYILHSQLQKRLKSRVLDAILGLNIFTIEYSKFLKGYPIYHKYLEQYRVDNALSLRYCSDNSQNESYFRSFEPNEEFCRGNYSYKSSSVVGDSGDMMFEFDSADSYWVFNMSSEMIL